MIYIQCIICLLVAFVLMYVLMPQYISYLHRLRFGQVEREDGPDSHKAKGGTPTMGGFLFVVVTVVALYICNAPYLTNAYANLLCLALLAFGAIGFVDDYLIVIKNNNDGLRAREKYALQSAAAIGFYVLARLFLPNFSTMITIPLLHAQINLHFVYLLLVYFMFTATSNAVNLADGLDGLATGLVIIALIPFMIFALIQRNFPVVLFVATLIGALFGFMVYNRHPAKIFMGDCGSLALGAILAALAIMTKQELLLIVIAAVPLVETLSVIIQVISFKTTGKRIFRMSPLHHHFELGGWSETKVVRVFWIAGILAAVVGVLLGVL
ncbi:MAG: phospho-N-acetylmuramoyl-pentapeptide-transferase [Erysipelotrichaceae bacterium]|nr:phospho-N-acetylmuramoyl-pentapeptide-transferase [Erysipelotrichaceae bacterium]